MNMNSHMRVALHRSSITFCCSLVFFAMMGCHEPLHHKKTLKVYVYSSFFSSWGPGETIEKLFKQKTGVSLDYQAFSGGGSLTAFIMDGHARPGSVVIGLSSVDVSRILKTGHPFQNYHSPALRTLRPSVSHMFIPALTPIDYGWVSLIYDTTKVTSPPQSYEELTLARYKKSFILTDPALSTPGLAFLLALQKTQGADLLQFVRRLSPSILAISPSWSTAYSLFQSGEAPYFLSYDTSAPEMNREAGQPGKYKVVHFKEGAYKEQEWAGVLGSKSRSYPKAYKLINFLLSPQAQKVLSSKNVMHSVISLSSAPAPAEGKALKSLDINFSAVDFRKTLETWQKAQQGT